MEPSIQRVVENDVRRKPNLDNVRLFIEIYWKLLMLCELLPGLRLPYSTTTTGQ